MSDFAPTAEQQAVIDHPLNPLRVSAGAGTGKTSTMALRLAALVDGAGLDPEAALGITFTNKAAAELAERVRIYLARFTSEGREVEITTYHGFAHRILEEFGALIGVERDALIVTPGYARQLLRDALGAGSYEHLDLTAAQRRVDELAHLAGRLGDHLVDAGMLAELAGDRIDEPWPARRELAAALERYQLLKGRLGAVDYADLIVLAHRVLERHPEIAARVRGRYRVVLLDEYQDTNPAQRRLLQLVFGDGFPVTAVGDPDQTIYEWRGASLANFAGFPDHFSVAPEVPAVTRDLTVNHRSDRLIIDVANAVKARISGSAGIAGLRPHEHAAPGSVEANWFRTAVDEAEAIGVEIRRLHQEEGVAWRNVAVLFRKNANINLIRQVLEAEDIPVEVAALGGLLQVPEVADLHAWLRLLGRPDDAPALVRILVGSRFRLGLGDLAPLAAWVRAQRGDRIDGDGRRWAMLEAVDQLDQVESVTAEASSRLTEFRSIYRRLLADAQGVTLVELCRRVLDRVGVWAEVEALGDAARLSSRLNLYRFLDLAEEWSPLEGRPSLEAFLDYLDLLDEEGASEELDTARPSGAEAVTLITVHRAKGLEWDTVFLPALCKGTFPSQGQALEDPSRYPHVLPRELEGADPLPSEPEKREELLRNLSAAQEWRTAYVAATRARHRLYLSGAFWYTLRRPKAPSPLWEVAAAVAGVRHGHTAEEAGHAPDSLRPPDVQGAPDPDFPTGWSAAMRSALDDPAWLQRMAAPLQSAYDVQMEQLSMTLDGLPAAPPPESESSSVATSVTGLVTYATCPKRFYWSEVDRLPRRPAPWLKRGVELHRRIELHNRGVVPLEMADEDAYDLTPQDADPAPVEGSFETFKKSRFAAIRPKHVEAPFDLPVGDSRIRGRIDAIYEPEPGSWEVVDFKSGRARPDPAKRVQLQAYALAAVEAGYVSAEPGALTATFAYLGDGLVEESESVDAAWLREARSSLESLTSGALTGDYPTDAGEACRGCDFLRFCNDGKAWVAAQV